MPATISTRRGGRTILAIFAAVAMFATLLPNIGSRAADHLDAPGLTPPGGEAAADIADLYAFAGSETTTAIAFTLPALSADAVFGSDLLYEVKVDTDGDAVEDESYEFTFSDVRDNGAQFLVAQHATGDAAADGSANGDLVAFGQVGKELTLNNGGTLWAGYRSDPFFFDLLGFQGTVEAADNDRMLNDGNENDFFLPLDVLSVVMEIPDYDGPISIWATTSDADGAQIDRMGRPAINTVVNSKTFGDETDKNVFNQSEPADDVANFTDKVVAVLQGLSALDTEGAYADDQAEALAGVLLPDVLPFDKEGALPPPLNGRGLADDVIDTELIVITGGDPLGLFDDRDEMGGVNTDGVGAHDDYLDVFPFLGEPNGEWTTPLLEGNDFAAALSGDNEVPAVETSATGFTALNATGSSVEHLTLAFGLEDVLQAHIHVGDADQNGPVVSFLYGPTDGEDVSGMLSNGVITDDDLVAGTVSDLLDVMNGGFAYVNAHTTANPGGDIRGQINALDMVDDRFTDDDGSVHATNIDLIAAAGITLGCNPPDNTEYCPDRDISRGEMAAFLDRALNLNDGDDAFTDDDDSIFEGNINAIAAVDITRGCNPPANDEYCPDDSLTRGEMAAFVNRAWNLPSTDTDYFSDDADSEFQNDINALAEAGVTLGCNPPANDQFCPDREMSRGEMASFLARAFGWGG